MRLGQEFFASLLANDAARAEQTCVAGCGYCGGPLSVGHDERKPRGALFASAGEEFTQRFSDCCSREGCRRRATPPSVRFLGPKGYLESAILVACALVVLIDDCARVIRIAIGVAARTVRRWMTWWRTVFAASRRPRLAPAGSAPLANYASWLMGSTKASTVFMGLWLRAARGV